MNCRTLSIALWFFSTGGIGTTIFYVAGIVLVLGAAAIVIARRKAEQE